MGGGVVGVELQLGRYVGVEGEDGRSWEENVR